VTRGRIIAVNIRPLPSAWKESNSRKR